jgi:hypothetical protein
MKWVFKQNHFKQLFPDFETDMRPVSFTDFNESGNFPVATKIANQKAHSILSATRPSTRMVSKYAKFRAFIKKEKQFKCTIFGLDENNRPRCIQACSPYASVSTGRWMKTFQQYLHNAWRGNLLFAAGLNAEQLSEWFSSRVARTAVFIEDDFTLYDSTFSVEAHDLCLRLFQKAGMEKNSPWGWAIRKEQVMAPGVGRLGHCYQVDGTMRSGVADTCLSNSIINALVHYFCLHEANPHLSLSYLLANVSMVVLGDDNLMMLPPGIKYNGLADGIRDFGLIPKLSVRKDSDEVVFLNMRPYPTDTPGLVRFAPRIGRLCARLGFSVEKQPDPRAYLHAVAKAFVKSCNHVPILRELMQSILDHTSCAKTRVSANRIHSELTRQEKYNVHSTSAAESGKLTKQFIYKVYGLTPRALSDVITLIDKIKQYPCLVYSPLLVNMALVDM